jgi:hypothetical protein
VAAALVTLAAPAADTTTRKRSPLSAEVVKPVRASVEEVAPETFSNAELAKTVMVTAVCVDPVATNVPLP